VVERNVSIFSVTCTSEAEGKNVPPGIIHSEIANKMLNSDRERQYRSVLGFRILVSLRLRPTAEAVNNPVPNSPYLIRFLRFIALFFNKVCG
jgi:hypothetical protein